MIDYILNNAIQLQEMQHHESYIDHVDDMYLDIVTQTKLHLDSIINDPLKLKEEFNRYYSESYSEGKLSEIVKILKKAKNYEGLDSKTDTLWTFIHPRLQNICKKKFDQKHYADAVETALKEINSIIKKHVKETTGQEFDGADLMNRAFSVNNPIIPLADLDTESGLSIQKGYMQIFAGAMTGIRNPKAHENLHPNQNITIHLLFIASFIMVKLQENGIIN